MNVIYNLFDSNSPNPIINKIEVRKSLLGISDELAFNKMIFAFFENGASIFRSEGNSTACAELEFFAGSISAETFRNNISEFLDSTEAKEKLDPTTLKSAKEFVEASKQGAEQAYLVDIARSNDIRYVFLAATGSGALLNMGNKFRADDHEINELVNHTLEKIKSLKPGESASFLSGTVIHETLFSVRCMPEGSDEEYEIYYCDSAQGKSASGAGAMGPLTSGDLIIKPASRENVQNGEFWNNFYESKLRDEKLDISSVFQNTYKTEEKLSKIASAHISSQKLNTCHIQCQVGLLKAFVIYRSDMPANEASQEWKQFKVSLGNFLIEKNIANKNVNLTSISNIGHEKNTKNLNKAAIFNQCIRDGKYMDTVKAYESAIEGKVKVDKKYHKADEEQYFNNLTELDKILTATLNKSNTQDDIVSLLEISDNSCVKFTLENFKSQLNKLQTTEENKLLEEINQCSSPGFISDIRSSIEGLLVNSPEEDYELQAKMRSNSGKAVAQSIDQLEKYLTLFENNPKWFSNLKNKPSFVYTLLQGIEAGFMEEVTSIVSKMEKKDRYFFNSLAFEERYMNIAPISLIQNACKTLDFSKIIKKHDYLNKPNEIVHTINLEKFEKKLILTMLAGLKNNPSSFIELQNVISTLDPEHQISHILENILAYHSYKSGLFEELAAVDCIRVVSDTLFPQHVPFAHTSETCQQALELLDKAPEHILMQEITTDLIFYAIMQKDENILNQVLSKCKNREFSYQEFEHLEDKEKLLLVKTLLNFNKKEFKGLNNLTYISSELRAWK